MNQPNENTQQQVESSADPSEEPKKPSLSTEQVALSLLVLSGVLALSLLAFGYSKVYCVKNCGSIVRFQYAQFRILYISFLVVQCFGWFAHLNLSAKYAKATILISIMLLFVTAWAYGVIFKWDSMATFYFGHIAPIMNNFLLL